MLVGANTTRGLSPFEWIFLFILSMTPSLGLAQDLGSWEIKADMPVPVLEAWAGELDGKIYVVGGFIGPSEATSTVQRYDPVSNEWEILSPYPGTTELTHVGLAQAGGRLFGIGGLDRNFVPSDAVFEYDPGSDTWSPREPLPDPRGAFGISVLGGKIYCSGGFPPATRGKDFSCYDPDTNEWEDLPALRSDRESHVSVTMDGKIYLFGGRVLFANAFVEVTEVYDPLKRKWDPLAPIPTPRGGLAGAAIGGRAYLFGGERQREAAYPDGVHPEVEEYDPVTDKWRLVSLMPFPRHGMIAIPLSGKIFIPGGGPVFAFSESDRLDCYIPPRIISYSGIRLK